MLITIVVTSYNYQQYLKDTMNSAISQTFTDWEMIVVDDASTDSSVEIIEDFAKTDNRIKLIRNEKNLGLQKTLQKGIEAASGEWVCFLESDDILCPQNLQKKVEIIKNFPEVSLIFNDVELFGDEEKIRLNKKKFDKSAEFLRTKKYPSNLFKDLAIFNRILTFSAVLVKKETLMKCDFNTPVDKCLDWWLFLHIAKDNLFYYIPEKLTRWRVHSGSYINKREKLFSCPVNLTALVDILKTGKDIKILPYVFLAAVNILPRLKARLVQLIKGLVKNHNLL